MPIHPQRLSRYIMSREHTKAVSSVLDIFGAMSREQRQEIKTTLEKNRDSKFIINQKYK